MNGFRFFVSFFLVVSLSIYSISSSVAGENYDPNIGIIARVTANILADQQYRHRSIDDTVSVELFKEYIKTLDPAKLYFTKEDLREFSRHEKDLDDQLQRGDISFAFLIYDRLLKRMKEYQKFANIALDKGFDFTINEEFNYNRKKAKHPTTKEQKELWRKRLKNDYLTLLLMDKVMKEELGKKSEKEKKKEKMTKLWQKKPAERIKKRIASSVKILESRKEIDKLEFYLNSLCHVFDPHSSYMPPKTLEDFNISMSLSLVGIGAVLTSDDGYTKIVNLIEGGPASKGGELAAEDRIVAVAQGNGEPVDIINMPLGDVVQLIRGKKGTVVNLSVLKGKNGLHGVPEKITIVRDIVKMADKSAKKEIKNITLPDGQKLKVGVIELPSFYIDFDGANAGKKNYKSSTRDVKAILESFTEEKVDGVILDLRRNGGGGLGESVRLTGLFFDKGAVVQIKGVKQSSASVKYDRDNKTYFGGPLIVMIDQMSASATEILAAAIQDYGRGVIVGGQHTHGKGTVQTIMNLNAIVKYYGVKSPSGALKLTNAKFYRINGDSTQIRGVTPDIIFPNYTDPMEIGEKYLDNALPWDSVDPVTYEKLDKLVAVIPTLRTKSEKRRAGSEKFIQLKKDIKKFDDIRKKKKVSLNKETRWSEYQTEKALLDKEKDMMEEADKKDSKKEDIYLDETMNILSDLIKSEKSKTN